MKSKWFPFAALFFLLCAVVPDAARAAGNRGKAEIAFSEGLLSYNQGNYVSAERSFERSFRLDPTRADASFFLGMSRFRLERYREAISAFQASIDLNPKNPEPFFYRGLSLYRLDQKEEAKDDFKKAASIAPEGPVKDLAESYLRSLEEGKEAGAPGARRPRRRWAVYGSLTTQYDSNVTLDPENITIATLPADQGDLQIAVRVGGSYDLVSREKYRLVSEAFYYQTIYPDLEDFSYGLAHAEIRNEFRRGNLFLQFPAAYEFSILQTAKYLQSARFSPSVNYLWRNFLTQLSPRFRLDSFFQTLTNAAQDRDARNLELEVAEYFFFEQRRRHFKVSYTFERNWADGNDWDYQAHHLNLSLYTPVVWRISATVSAGVTIDKGFDNVDSIIGTRRDDFAYSYGLTLSRPLTEFLTLSAHYYFRHNASNIAFFEYNKHLAGMTLGFHL
jgi:tetratricopeptide (TPR) repeat protein